MPTPLHRSSRPASQLLLLCFALLSVAGNTVRADELRFSAQFVSGTRLTGAEIHDWHDPKAQPRLDARPLFDPSDPVRWIQDNTLALADVPPMYVEFHGGDCLPGRLTGVFTGLESPYQQLPVHLLIQPDLPIDWPDAPRTQGIRVAAHWVRRLVWLRRENQLYRPGTLFYRDGRQVEFRSVRWSGDALRLLLEQGTREVPYAQVAEVHLPRVDVWDLYYEQLAQLTPDCTSWLMSLETSDGLRATTSLERLLPATRGGGDPNHWFHLVQPAWSLDPLWVQHRTIRMRRFFRPHEVPLSAVEPRRTVQKSALSGAWNWQANRNVKGTALRSAEQMFAWGLGVQSHNELEFELPAAARTFRSFVCLDRAAGRGGCVRAAVYLGAPSSPPLFHSKHLIGSTEVLDTGALALATTSTGPRTLTLVVDAAHTDRPPGADPLEIRDLLDWSQPLLELDPAEVKLEAARRAPRCVSAWHDWTVDTPGGVRLVNFFDLSRPRTPTYRMLASALQSYFTLSRRLSVSGKQKFLMLAVSRYPEHTGPASLQVWIDKQPVAAFEIPVRHPGIEPDPLLVPIDRYRGRNVQVQIAVLGDSPKSLCTWRGLSLLETDPSQLRLFEDEPRFAGDLREGDAIPLLDSEDKYSGTASLKITPGSRWNAQLPGWNISIRDNPGLGEYRYLRFAWKKIEGREIGIHLAKRGVWGPEETKDVRSTLRYYAGAAKRPRFSSVILSNKPPQNWEVQTRDLAAEFGNFDLTGLRLDCLDGNAALFDHIYLVRTPPDLEKLPNPKAPPVQDPLARLTAEMRANLLQYSDNPAGFADIMQAFAPALPAFVTARELGLLKEHAGKTGVLMTHPFDQGRPAVLTTPVSLPKDKPSRLYLTVSHDLPQGNWLLIVKANGEKVHEALIGKETAPQGWAEVVVDLSRFAGQNVWLELLNQANDWTAEHAYWSRIELRSE